MMREARGASARTRGRRTLVIEFFEESSWLGGSVYLDNLLATLSALPEGLPFDVRIEFLSSHRTPAAGRLLRHPVVDRRASASSAGRGCIAARRALRALIRRRPSLGRLLPGRPHEIHFPAFNTSQSWRRNLFWIPDFQHHYLPHLFEPEELAWRDRCYAAIARSEGVLVLSSAAALNDFRTFYPNARVQPRVWSFCSSVESSGAADCTEVRRRHRLPEHFVYVANQFWRHKDHRVVVEALLILRERGVTPHVVCTGVQEDRRDADYFPGLRQRVDTYGLAGQMHLLGVVPRDEQLQLFRLAATVVQPSRFEGWSTVIEDARAFGRPVIASDLPVHREQLAGDPAARFFAPGDADALASLLDQATRHAPGPDPAAEAAAAETTRHRRVAAAHRFVSIIAEAFGDNTVI